MTEITEHQPQVTKAIDGIKRGGKKKLYTPSSSPKHFEDYIHTFGKEVFQQHSLSAKW